MKTLAVMFLVLGWSAGISMLVSAPCQADAGTAAITDVGPAQSTLARNSGFDGREDRLSRQHHLAVRRKSNRVTRFHAGAAVNGADLLASTSRPCLFLDFIFGSCPASIKLKTEIYGISF